MTNQEDKHQPLINNGTRFEVRGAPVKKLHNYSWSISADGNANPYSRIIDYESCEIGMLPLLDSSGQEFLHLIKRRPSYRRVMDPNSPMCGLSKDFTFQGKSEDLIFYTAGALVFINYELYNSWGFEISGGRIISKVDILAQDKVVLGRAKKRLEEICGEELIELSIKGSSEEK